MKYTYFLTLMFSAMISGSSQRDSTKKTYKKDNPTLKVIHFLKYILDMRS